MNIIEKALNKKFKEGVTCPCCEGKSISKFGFYRGEQRYQCKDCGKTFTKYSNTILNWSHYKNKWVDFIESMERGETLREAGEKINIYFTTLHYWRHKILNILNEDNEDEIKGEVEIFKKCLPYENKYRKDEDYHKDSDLEKDINLVILYQRNHKISSFIYRDSTLPIDFLRELVPLVDKDAIFYLPSTHPFRFPMIGLKLNFKDTLKGAPEGCSYYDFSVINYTVDFCHFMYRFNGVSTKYLPKYLSYFMSLEVFKNMKEIVINSFNRLVQPSLGIYNGRCTIY